MKSNYLNEGNYQYTPILYEGNWYTPKLNEWIGTLLSWMSELAHSYILDEYGESKHSYRRFG